MSKQKQEELLAQIEALETEIATLKEVLADAEDSYDALHHEFITLETETSDYVDNKDSYNVAYKQLDEFKEFVIFVQEECEVKPNNEDLYRMHKNLVNQAIRSMGV